MSKARSKLTIEDLEYQLKIILHDAAYAQGAKAISLVYQMGRASILFDQIQELRGEE